MTLQCILCYFKEHGTLTAAEAAHIHAATLQHHPNALDPFVLSRIRRGLAMTAPHYVGLQQARVRLQRTLDERLAGFDMLMLPTVPCVAPRIDQASIEVDGQQVSARANLGMFTQPLGLAGCPVLAVPLRRPGRLPLGVQLVAAPGREDRLFALARQLEAIGLTGVSPPPAEGQA